MQMFFRVGSLRKWIKNEKNRIKMELWYSWLRSSAASTCNCHQDLCTNNENTSPKHNTSFCHSLALSFYVRVLWMYYHFSPSATKNFKPCQKAIPTKKAWKKLGLSSGFQVDKGLPSRSESNVFLVLEILPTPTCSVSCKASIINIIWLYHPSVVYSSF